LHSNIHTFPTRRSSDLTTGTKGAIVHIIPDDDPIAGQESELYFDMQDKLPTGSSVVLNIQDNNGGTKQVSTKIDGSLATSKYTRSEEHTSELQSRENLV